MYQSLLILQARTPGALDQLVRGYRRERVLEAALPFGILRSEAVTVPGRPTQLIVGSLWPNGERYEDWLDSDERARVTSWLPPLLDPQHPPRIRTSSAVGRSDLAEPIDFGGVAENGALERLITVVAKTAPAR